MREQFVKSFATAALSPDPDLAIAALMIARVEYPKLDAGPYLDELDALGREAQRRLAAAPIVPGEAPPRVDPDRYARVMVLNEYLFKELRFVGNEVQYEDPRNSFLNELLLAVDPSAINELRDRGLLAYHLKDFSAALRDLQAYLQLSAATTLDEEEREEHAQIWEHVKTLRRRVASLN